MRHLYPWPQFGTSDHNDHIGWSEDETETTQEEGKPGSVTSWLGFSVWLFD